VKRLVFLDFDGVVMTSASYERAGNVRHLPQREQAIARLDHDLVANLSVLCERAEAAIVLSTSWRGTSDEDRAGLEGALWTRGLSTAIPVVGQTPRSPGGYRGDEIAAWLDKHRPGWTHEDVVVLDDDSDLEPLMERWVQCSWVEGFHDLLLVEALALWGLP
jgi:hypothetical protein